MNQILRGWEKTRTAGRGKGRVLPGAWVGDVWANIRPTLPRGFLGIWYQKLSENTAKLESVALNIFQGPAPGPRGLCLLHQPSVSSSGNWSQWTHPTPRAPAGMERGRPGRAR